MNITCDQNAECMDIMGSYACVCHPGYIGNGVSNCCKLFPSFGAYAYIVYFIHRLLGQGLVRSLATLTPHFNLFISAPACFLCTKLWL